MIQDIILKICKSLIVGFVYFLISTVVTLIVVIGLLQIDIHQIGDCPITFNIGYALILTGCLILIKAFKIKFNFKDN